MTRGQLEQELDADKAFSRCFFYSVEDAIEASDERPGMDLIRERQNVWQKFWSKRGTDPIEANEELVDLPAGYNFRGR
jgi:hypothetical protein